MRKILILLLLPVLSHAQTFNALYLRGSSHAPYTNLGRTLNWGEMDYNFYNLGDAVRNLQATAGGATNLDGLSDVIITTPSTGQLVRFNGTNWVNVTLNSLSGYGILDGALDANVVHKTGTETIAGNKTFSNSIFQGLNEKYYNSGVTNSLQYIPTTLTYSGYSNAFGIVHSGAYNITGPAPIRVVDAYYNAFLATNNTSNVRLFTGALTLTSSFNTVGNYHGLYLESTPGSGSINGNAYGIYLESINKGGAKYAIYSNLGRVSFGDTLQLRNLAGTGKRVMEVDANGNSSANYKAVKVLSTVTAGQNSGTGATTVHTYPSPTNFFEVGDVMRGYYISYYGSAITHSKYYTLKLNGTTIFFVTYNGTTTVNERIEFIIQFTSSTTALATVWEQNGSSLSNPTKTTVTLTIANAQTLSLDVQADATGEVILQGGKVIHEPN